MENRKKKTLKTDNYLHSVKQNYNDNMVDCFLFFTDGLQGVPKVRSSALQVRNAVHLDCISKSLSKICVFSM